MSPERTRWTFDKDAPATIEESGGAQHIRYSGAEPLPAQGPRTEAGKALLDRLGDLPKLMPYDDEAVEAVLAIEREAASPALDVERLAAALDNLDPHWFHDAAHGAAASDMAEALAAEYARLAQDRSPEPSE